MPIKLNNYIIFSKNNYAANSVELIALLNRSEGKIPRGKGIR